MREFYNVTTMRMYLLECVGIVLVFVVAVTLADLEAVKKNRLRNRDREHDADHVRQHLDGVVEMKQEPLAANEEQFQYFKVHDYDNNNMLDGIELISALTHFHKEEEPSHSKPLTDDDLTGLIDTILKEDDHNLDGYVDYAEFMLSQRG